MVRRRRVIAPIVVALVASLLSLVASVDPAAAKTDKPKNDGGGVPAPTPMGSSNNYVGLSP